MIKEIANKLKGAKKKQKLKEKKQEIAKAKESEKNAIKQGTVTANVISSRPETVKKDIKTEKTTPKNYVTSPIMSRGTFSSATKYNNTPDRITENGPSTKSIHKSNLTTSERAKAIEEGYKEYKKKYGRKKK